MRAAVLAVLMVGCGGAAMVPQADMTPAGDLASADLMTIAADMGHAGDGPTCKVSAAVCQGDGECCAVPPDYPAGSVPGTSRCYGGGPGVNGACCYYWREENPAVCPLGQHKDCQNCAGTRDPDSQFFTCTAPCVAN